MENYDIPANALRPSLLREALIKEFRSPKPRPVWISGPPGVGKSDLVRSIAAELGVELRDVRVTLLDAVDLRGLPSIENGVTRWCPPAFLPTEGEGILFLDELPDAAPSVKSALYSLCLDRCIGEYVLPDGWHIIAAGNRMSDRAAAGRNNTALDSRFRHYDYVVDVDDWCEWAIASDIRTELVRFIRFRRELLHSFDPKSNSRSFPCPRTWEYVNDALNAGHSADTEYAALAGTVGEGAAAELSGFLRVWRSLPSPDAILLNPDTADVPGEHELDVVYALSGSLINAATEDNFDAIVTYAERLPEEARMFLIKDAVRVKPELIETGAFVRFSTANKHLF